MRLMRSSVVAEEPFTWLPWARACGPRVAYINYYVNKKLLSFTILIPNFVDWSRYRNSNVWLKKHYDEQGIAKDLVKSRSVLITPDVNVVKCVNFPFSSWPIGPYL